MMKSNMRLLILLFLSFQSLAYSQSQSLQLSPTSESPKVDGMVSLKEWQGSLKLEMKRTPKWKVGIQVTYDKENIYVAFSNLAYPGMPKLNAEVMIQTDLSTNEWSDNTFWFHSSYSNCEAQGKYYYWESCSDNATGWEANTFPLEKGKPHMEFKISFSKLQLESPAPGTKIRLAFKLSDAKEFHSYWPSDASIQKPATWGVAIF